jgi:hypothetical protein
VAVAATAAVEQVATELRLLLPLSTLACPLLLALVALAHSDWVYQAPILHLMALHQQAAAVVLATLELTAWQVVRAAAETEILVEQQAAALATRPAFLLLRATVVAVLPSVVWAAVVVEPVLLVRHHQQRKLVLVEMARQTASVAPLLLTQAVAAVAQTSQAAQRATNLELVAVVVAELVARLMMTPF